MPNGETHPRFSSYIEAMRGISGAFDGSSWNVKSSGDEGVMTGASEKGAFSKINER